MAVMEGPLSKWTNVMKGWQYRWFVLDDCAGLLSYYTSKEKMVRGARRGCVRLKGAMVGIDDDDDSTFTITVDAKTFHFQAHDADEREKWIRGLEDTIVRHTPSIRRWDPNKPAPTMADFDKKLTESDAYLQLLIDQADILERHLHSAEDEQDRRRCQNVVDEVNSVLESVKHTIVLLQIAKNTAFPVNGVYHPCNAIPEGVTQPTQSIQAGRGETGGRGRELVTTGSEEVDVEPGIEMGRECAERASVTRQRSPVPIVPLDSVVPETSYSSSEDEDFFDADDFGGPTPVQSPSGPRLFDDSVETIAVRLGTSDGGVANSSGEATVSAQSPLLDPSATTEEERRSDVVSASSHSPSSPSPVSSPPHRNSGSIVSPGTVDYDRMYEDDDDQELGSMEGHGSVIHHLLSQVKIGMDLTKVVLPTFILERRSLLEMYADFFAHPDLFCKIADMSTPQDRMVQVLKWYLSAFHAGRKSEVARKPYNPILGEVFRCYWDIPGESVPENTTKETVTDGPIPWATSEKLCFVAEQVSHHPPISAFYAEHRDRRISFCGHIWTKSKFLGLSICVYNIGQGCVSLMDHDEEYILNFPSGYGRSILTVPWVELGGTCQITCNKTGYNASVEFLTKPFYGGKKHRISAEVLSPGEKKPVLTVEGEWNGVMTAKWANGMSETFVDTQSMNTVRKNVKPMAEQAPNESRIMWRNVTAGLKFNQIDQATEAKFALEQKQREEAKHRKENNLTWETKLFELIGENWIYTKPLLKRLNQRS